MLHEGCCRGGVLTLTWYTYMCLPFKVLFREIWYSDRGFHQKRRSPNHINWVYFGQIIVNSTQFGQNWVLFFQKWYIDGWEIRQKVGIEKVRFLRSYPRTIFVKVTPRGADCNTYSSAIMTACFLFRIIKFAIF